MTGEKLCDLMETRIDDLPKPSMREKRERVFTYLESKIVGSFQTWLKIYTNVSYFEKASPMAGLFESQLTLTQGRVVQSAIRLTRG